MRTLGPRGMVASPQYLATGAGVNVLRRGGNAIDAAIATNAVLAVVTPYLCGIGGDLFALVRTASGELVGLNGSGRAPAEATPERMRALSGADRMPARGPLPINVPGCVEAWGALHSRFGRIPLADILTDAIDYAERGFPLPALFSRAITNSASFLHPGTPALETFLPGGKVPREGEMFRQVRLARTLRTIAREGTNAYYEGEIGREIARAVRSVGGLLSEEDLKQHSSDWVEPLSVRYRDLTVYELPPNSQGIVALMMLAMLQHLPEDSIKQGGAEYVHLMAEVARLAYADRDAYITDLDHMPIPPHQLLSEEYGRSRAALVRERAEGPVPAGSPGDTIYLCTADDEGNLVSLIESNFMGIGSGVMGGETGVMLQNRGHWFSLDPTHPNVIAPRKRTMHTLMPAMAFRGDTPVLVFGTMGGSTQAQIHAEVLTRLVDQGMASDEALAAPRFDAVPWENEGGEPRLIMEDRFPPDVLAELRHRGHEIELIAPFSSAVGHSHMIQVLPDGGYVGAADPRADSLAMGY